MFLAHDNISDNDIIQLVAFLQGRPQFLSFDKACFIVAKNTGKTVEEVIRICRNDYVVNALIEEAMRVPQQAQRQRPQSSKGEVIIF